MSETLQLRLVDDEEEDFEGFRLRIGRLHELLHADRARDRRLILLCDPQHAWPIVASASRQTAWLEHSMTLFSLTTQHPSLHTKTLLQTTSFPAMLIKVEF